MRFGDEKTHLYAAGFGRKHLSKERACAELAALRERYEALEQRFDKIRERVEQSDKLLCHVCRGRVLAILDKYKEGRE